MRKRINLKALGIIIVVLALLATGVHFLHSFQVRSQAGILLAHADRATDERDFQAAANYLARYVALEPGKPDARARLALLLADEQVATTPKALMRAYFALSRAVQLAPDRDDVRRRLIELAMGPALGRFNDAVAHLDKLPPSELLGLRARCAEETGKYKEARAYYERAIVQSPTELANYIGLAYLLHDIKKSAEVRRDKNEITEEIASATINAMVDANPKTAKAYLLRARYLQKKEDDLPTDRQSMLRQVESDVQKARELDPLAVDVILAVAALAREQTDRNAARELLQKGIKANPEAWSLVQALSQLEMLDGHPQAALACLRDGLKQNPKQLDLLWNYAHLLIQQRDHKEAAGVIASLGEAGMRREDLDYLDARIWFNREEWSKAARILERAYPLFLRGYDQRQDWFSLNLYLECSFLLGNCYEQMGDPYRAATAYDRMLAQDPRSVAGRRGLARMKWALGQFDAAEQQYQQLISQGTVSSTVWVEAIQLLIAHHRRSEHPQWDKVLQLLEEAKKVPDEKLRPPEVTLALLSAEVRVEQKNYELARQALEEVCGDTKGKTAEISIALAGLEMQRGNTKEALATLDDAVKKHGDRVELQMARARIWARRGGAEATKGLSQLGKNLDRLDDADRLRLLRVLAESHQQIGDYAEATRLWRKVALQRESDIGSRFTLFELALQTGDQAGMQRLTKEIERIEGEDEGTLWRYCLACQKIWQAERGDRQGLPDAVALLKLVGGRRPGWSRVPLALGQIDDLQDKHDSAVTNFITAVRLGEQRPGVIRQLVRILTERGYHEAAAEMIGKMGARAPSLLAGLERPVAEIELVTGNTNKALNHARQAVPADSKDYRDHIWYGQLLSAAGKTAEAEESFRRAIAIADQEPATWVALVQHFVRINDKPRAEAAIREAEQKLPKGKALLNLAQCYDMIGESDRAKKLYEAAFAARPEDSDVLRQMALVCVRTGLTERAEAHLQKIKQLKTSTPKAVAEANRLLALIKAARGGNENTQAALALLEASGDGSPNSPVAAESAVDQRVKAMILASDPSVRKRRQAIDIFEGLQRAKLSTPTDQFLLAQLHDGMGEWRKTRSLMVDLLSAAEYKLDHAKQDADKKAWKALFGDFLAYYSINLVRHDDLAEAEAWQTKLEQVEPLSARSLEVKARLLGKQMNSAAAVPFLKKLADSDNKLVRPVAHILEEIGQTAAAEQMFEKYVAESKEAERVLALAAFLGRQNRPREALDVCDRAWKTCPPEAVSSTSAAILYLAKSAGPQYQRVASRLEQAIVDHPDKPALLTDLASVRCLQGRHDDALKLLQQAGARDKSNSVVQNNIAWLLVFAGKTDEAWVAIEKAISIRGEQTNLLGTRAVIHMAKGRYNEAIRDLETAIVDRPTAVNYFHLAQAHLGAKNQTAALQALDRGKSLGLTESTVDPLERTAYQQLMQIDRR